ncbi:MAG: ankyrin repeat domain-containing protein [Sphingomonas sp.]|nr:ankyrin repeat domain-containing protein [Sphingomonas sp.]
MIRNDFLLAATIGASILATPVAAQAPSDAHQFVTAVREREGNKAVELLRARGVPILNSHDEKGDTALVIAMGRRDDVWAGFLLGQGADPNLAARNGDTPLMAAARAGFAIGASDLVSRKARINAANRKGETALILAVQQRHLPIVRLLLAAGADPDKTDNAAGYSARDYAMRDARSREILRLIVARKPKP